MSMTTISTVTVLCDRCDHTALAPFAEVEDDYWSGDVYIRCTAWPAHWVRNETGMKP
jgi:hypothetical protein